MADEIRKEELTGMFETFFEECDYLDEIRRLADVYPEERSLTLLYSEIEDYDISLAEYLHNNPNKALFAAEEALKKFMHPDKIVPIHFRVKRLPADMKVDIRNLRSKHLGKFIAVEGLSRKATEVRPKLVDANFECLRCGQILKEAQEGLMFKEPLECYKEQAGCGRTAASTKFRLLTEDSRYVDTQKIEIQEFPEGLRGGAQPQRLTSYSEDDLAGKISPGDRITLIGTLRSTQKTFPVKSTLFDIFLDVNYIEMEEYEFEEIQISEEEEERIMEVSQDSEIYRRITSSISPSIYGMNTEKEALALQLFGGVAKEMPDGTRIRGDIHILMVGDPGTAKSQLLRYMSELAPRGIYASGKSSSAAGLTAAAVKDEFGEGRWTLEAGALVLADKGLACIDELDKMSSQDRSSLHEAMEQQRISVAKAGITATLQSRCSMLAAANPKYGRFDEHAYIFEQINIPVALLSRFDVIFTITDKPESSQDSRIAEHILHSHLVGEIGRYEKEIGPSAHSSRISSDDGRVTPYFESDFLRKYVAYAKKKVIPIMSPEASQALRDYYVGIRKLGEGEGASVPITARQLEAFIRLAEASARIRLSDEVTEDDARRAIRIVEYYLKKVAGEDGQYDIDIIASGTSRSLRDQIKVVRDIITKMSSEGGDVMHEDILSEASVLGVERSRVETIIKRLYRDEGWIYERSAGRYRLTKA